jgi:hypothetical protein
LADIQILLNVDVSGMQSNGIHQGTIRNCNSENLEEERGGDANFRIRSDPRESK